jgi:hypothetical protein
MDWPNSFKGAYLVLLAFQIAGTVILTWIELPEFRQLLVGGYCRRQTTIRRAERAVAGNHARTPKIISDTSKHSAY